MRESPQRERVSSDVLLQTMRATGPEVAAVTRAMVAILRFEHWYTYERPPRSQVEYTGVTAEQEIAQSVSWIEPRRRRLLESAAIQRANEMRGNKPWREELNSVRAA